MSLQWRLVAALLLVVLTTVAGGTLAHLAEISRELEASLSRQATRVIQSIQANFESMSNELDSSLRSVVQSRQMKRWLSRMPHGRPGQDFERFQSNELEVLKVIDSDGRIIISSHWPSSFGALDPNIHIYSSSPGTIPRIVDEPLPPSGTAISLQRWAIIAVNGKELIVVEGKFLGQSSLDDLRKTGGADILALCRQPSAQETTDTHCFQVGGEEFLEGRPFRPDDPIIKQRYLLNQFSIGGDAQKPTFLIAGMDRATVSVVRDGVMLRSLITGLISILFALFIGALLASRIAKPLQALADVASRWAEGDLTVRIDTAKRGGGKEEQRLVNAFNQMAADLGDSRAELMRAERVAAWQEIARGLAHELKNPLTPIRGAVEVIRKARALNREDFDDILVEQSEAVLEEVSRLKELSDAFARFAKLPEPKFEELQFQDLVDYAISLYASDDMGLEVKRYYPPKPLSIVADRTQLMTAITNLVKNAAEAVESKGTIVIRIEQESSDADTGPMLVFSVEDSGPGVAEEAVGRVFTPYFTTKGSSGTGLGLALVHRIVVEHGGQINVAKSEQLGGAAFVMRLPVARLKGRKLEPSSD